MGKMTVYHGSYTIVENPEVIRGGITTIYDLADIYHSDNIERVSDDFIRDRHHRGSDNCL